MGSCNRIKDLLGPYIYGDLTPEEMREVRLHIEQCSRCADELKAATQVVGMVPSELPALTDEERQQMLWTVKGAIKARQQPVQQRSFAFTFARGFAITAAVAAVFAGGIVVGLRSKPPKLIVKEIPVKQQPQTLPEPEKRIVEEPVQEIDVPITPPQQIAIQPVRRDRQPIYRGGRSDDRNQPLKIVDDTKTESDVLQSGDPQVPVAPIPEGLNSADLGRLDDIPADDTASEKPSVPDNPPAN